ncbi:MAG: alanine:cation symporter family protein [Lachnospiraceae bacterium]|nr:alanine:cation symporter family protein [Lachnospiraceae bacterium]
MQTIPFYPSILLSNPEPVEEVVTLTDRLIEINTAINDFVWVKIGLILLIGSGILLTIITKFFQITHLPHWVKKTMGGVFKKDAHNKNEEGSVSQFQAMCTALAATIGTGNIAGVSAAIVLGGPGAVFWMWVAAFFGMMTNFSENVLGIYYRLKNKDGDWSGGAMYYLRDGLAKIPGYEFIGKTLAFLFAVFTVLASFGIGNMGQVNKITLNINSAFFSNMESPVILGSIPLIPLIIGIVLMILAALIILGGLKRIANVAEKVVPFMAGAYVLGALVLIVLHFDMIIPAFLSIFRFAFGVEAVGGAATGILIKTVITQGCKRGVFSNEAGLGSSVMVHCNSNVKEPVKQGLWGIFEVFADTMVVCTITALVVLTSGFIDLNTGLALEGVSDATLVAQAFGNSFGAFGEGFVAISLLLFAFTTILGWSHYGCKAVEFLFGKFGIMAAKIYRVFFVLMILSGALMTSSLAWDISDTFNGLMMIPNLIGVISLSPVLVRITRNYIDRKIKGKNVEPVLSNNPVIQAEMAQAVAEGKE